MGTIPASSSASVVQPDIRFQSKNILLLVFLQHLVTIVLNSSKHFINEIGRLGRKKPTQSNDAFGNGTQVVYKRRSPVGLPDIVDCVRSSVKLSHKLGRLDFWLLRLGRNVEVGALRLEGLEDSVGLWDR